MIQINEHALIAVALVWLLVCALRGYYKGFLREAYTVAEIILALVCLWAMSRRMSIFVGGIPTLGGFLAILFVLHWIGKLLDIINHIPILGGMNRTLGVIIGLAKGLFVLGLVYSWLGSSIAASLKEIM